MTIFDQLPVSGAPAWRQEIKYNAIAGADVVVLTARATLCGLGPMHGGQRRLEVLLTIAEKSPGEVVLLAAERFPAVGMKPLREMSSHPAATAAKDATFCTLLALGGAVADRDASQGERMPGTSTTPLPVRLQSIRYEL